MDLHRDSVKEHANAHRTEPGKLSALALLLSPLPLID